MLRGEGSYYTPISADGQVVEKRVESIEVTRDSPGPAIVVRYSLTNPYDHTVSVPIQSGLTMLYQYAQSDDDLRDPELHVVPATVSSSSGEVIYVADEPLGAFGATAIQRQHLGTGVPNYRHPVAVNVTLVPGDSVLIEARAEVPEKVRRMILVDAMVGPDRPYGIYPQLLEPSSNTDRVPPPLRIYPGASFHSDPPHVQMPQPDLEERRTARSPAARLPRWISPERYARLQQALRHDGRLWSLSIGLSAILLSLSMLFRSAGTDLTRSLVHGAQGLVFAALTVGLLRRMRVARIALAVLLGVTGVAAAVEVVAAVLAAATLAGDAQIGALLTESTLIPILYLSGAAILVRSPAIRAYTTIGTARTRRARRSRGRTYG